MALQLDRLAPSGVTATYHRVVRMEADYEQMQAWVMVHSYYTQEARDCGCEPLKRETIVISLPLPSEIGPVLPGAEHVGDIRPIGYLMLKSLPDFAGAIDA